MELFATMIDEYVGVGVNAPIPPPFQLYQQLDLPRFKVFEMNRNLRRPSQMRKKFLDLYATGHPCPSWRQVAKVLREVELDHQADTVESTYVQGTRIIPMHPLSVTFIIRFVMA